MLTKLSKDRQFWVAILLGFAVWVGWFLYLNMTGLHHSQEQDQMRIFFLTTLVFPVVEEICFRGLLQSYLINFVAFQKQYLKISGANFVTSIVFVLMHFIYKPAYLAVLVLFPSLVFGYFRDKYGSVLPAIILHMVYNAGWLCVSWI